MVDEVVISQETTQVEVPAPTVSASTEAEMPVVEIPITVAETPTETTAQTLNPAETGSGAVGGSEPMINTNTNLDSGSGQPPRGDSAESRMTQTPYEPGPQIKSGETQKGEITKPAETPLNSTKVESGTQSPPVPVVVAATAGGFGMRELLLKAKDAIAFRKRKKLDKVMGIFLKRTSVTNDEVEKLLHVSDATATRYLSILEKEGKIVQTGKSGRGVSYTKI